MKDILVSPIAFLARRQPQALKDAACVGIYYEGRLRRGIEEDIVGGFIPDSMYGKQFFSQPCGFPERNKSRSPP